MLNFLNTYIAAAGTLVTKIYTKTATGNGSRKPPSRAVDED